MPLQQRFALTVIFSNNLRFLIYEKEEFIERLENSENRDREYRRLERARREHKEQQDLLIQLKEANPAFSKSSQFHEFASGAKRKYLWDYLLINVGGQRMGENVVDRFFY